jgi:2-isopropylmalate synthase
MTMTEAFAIEPGTYNYLDTTGRDGDQAQPFEHQFQPGDKPGWAAESAAMGIATIEAGFPTTPSDAEEVAEVARTVGRTAYEVTPHYMQDDRLVAGQTYAHTPVITGLSRATEGDIENTWAAVEAAHRPGIHTFIATDPLHIATKFPGKSPNDIVNIAGLAVRHARKVSDGLAVVEFSAEAASSTPRDYLERVVKTALDEGADVINLPDTLGLSSPRKIGDMFSAVTKWVVEGGFADSVTISTHCHNDYGMATANTISAVQAVAETAREMGSRVPNVQAEVVFGGRGERAGNASAEQVIMASQAHADEFQGLVMPRVDITHIAQAAGHVFAALSMEIPPTAPIIGTDTRTHRSGIHSAAIIQGGARVYTPYDPRWVGHQEAAIIAPGGYQGTKGNNNLGPMNVY